ncbi:MAG TPA: SGNH/GDSL hydrolase family protein [Polyangiaceae bacterium]|nr:SGNH/GDSL hydrolase family protein [Polyangiaceae bacterium]
MTTRLQRRAALPSTTRGLSVCLFALLSVASAVGCSSEPGKGDSLDSGGASSLAGKAGSSAAGQGQTEASGGSAGVAGSPAGGAAVAGGGATSAAGAGSTNGGAMNGGGAGSAGGPGAGASGGASIPAVHYVGRVDTSDPTVARFAWSGTGAIVRFNGSGASVDLDGGQEYTVVVDGTVQPKLVAKKGANTLAQGLAAGEHSVELYRRTEANQGESEIHGFDFGGGQLLAPRPVTRRLEFIGDSITCGYGDEGADASCGFTAQTENHYLTYAAITARNLQAELSTVAWSGKGVVCNYGDDANSCTDPLPTYYNRTLPNRADSVWDFSLFQPDAVVINLGTNDLSTNSDPDQATFESAYKALLVRVRQAYPNARILCTNGPLLSGTDLDTVRRYIGDVVTALADPKISTFEIAPQDGSDGYGCDYHPSLERHKKMATVVTAALKTALGW